MVPDQNGELTKPDDDAAVSILLGKRQGMASVSPTAGGLRVVGHRDRCVTYPRFGGQLSPKFDLDTRRTTCWRSIFALPTTSRVMEA